MSEIAHFPISGPITSPTAADYALEATHLYNEAAMLWKSGSRTRSLALNELADRYRSITRRLSWVPNSARRQEQAA